jgi:hypothetical protein
MLIKVEQGVLLLRIKLPFAIVVGLLFCTLATMELPELINLVDDTSNDFSLIVFVKNAATVVKVQMLRKGRPALADVQPRQATARFSTRSLIQTFYTLGDTLHLLCVQRT